MTAKYPMKFRKKPVVIEAIRFTGTNEVDIVNWSNGAAAGYFSDHRIMQIRTLEGDMTAEPGDWIIRGIKGEFYPCKPDIFEATYETVSE